MKYLLLILAFITNILFILILWYEGTYDFELAKQVREIWAPIFLYLLIIDCFAFIIFLIYQKFFIQKIFNRSFSLKNLCKTIFFHIKKSTKIQSFVVSSISFLIFICYSLFIGSKEYYILPLLGVEIQYRYIVLILLMVNFVCFTLFLDKVQYKKNIFKKNIGIISMLLLIISFVGVFLFDNTSVHSEELSPYYRSLFVSFSAYTFIMYWWVLDLIERK
jgi:hypothetical protein